MQPTTAASPARAPHLTPTARMILSFVKRHEGRPCSKAQIAAALGRSQKTIDRLISELRAQGLLVSEPVYADNGGQLANTYRTR